jgi:hypothetical protein
MGHPISGLMVRCGPPVLGFISISILENRAELIGSFERFIWVEEVLWFVFDVGLSAGFAQIWGLTGIWLFAYLRRLIRLFAIDAILLRRVSTLCQRRRSDVGHSSKIPVAQLR